MKNFIISFLLTTSAIIYLNLPVVMASPFDSIGRIIMYLALPASIFVMIAGMALVEFVKWAVAHNKHSVKVNFHPVRT